MSALRVTKSSGVQEPFSESKLVRSLRRCGAKRRAIEATLDVVRKEAYPGISTKELYRMAFNALRSQSRPLAARYSLKNAIFQLGPSGFPFEKYIAALFSAQGFQTTVNVTLPGNCITHEIDVVAVKDGRRLFMECKYHNQAGKICDIKIGLYVHARALDLKATHPDSEFRLVTNTRFSSDVIRYAHCVQLPILGWDYPAGEGLKDLIPQYHLHPVTCLTTLNRRQKAELLQSGMVLCKDLTTNSSTLRRLGLSEFQCSRVLDEIAGI